MRITNLNLQRQALSGMMRNLREVDQATRQVASGLKLETASDDAAVAVTVMRVDSQLRANDRYRQNLVHARSALGLEEGVLSQLTDALARAREVGLSQGTSTASTETRLTAAKEIRELLAFARELGNTRLGDRYIFGGDHATTAPFPEAGVNPARLPEGDTLVEVAPGRHVPTVHSGVELLLDTDALDALDALAGAMEAGDIQGIRDATFRVEGAHTSLQTLFGELGARMIRVDMSLQDMARTDISLTELRSDLRDVELEEVMTRLTSRQTAYQAALLVTSNTLTKTLADYLR